MGRPVTGQPDPKPEPRKKHRQRDHRTAAAARAWHDQTVALGCQVCEHLGEECEGVVDAHHVLRKQFIMDWVGEHVQAFPAYGDPDARAMLEREVLWYPGNGMGVCYRAHRRHHNRVQPIQRLFVPTAAWKFAKRLGLTRRLEQDYPDGPHACGLQQQHGPHSWVTFTTPFYCTGSPAYRVLQNPEDWRRLTG